MFSRERHDPSDGEDDTSTVPSIAEQLHGAFVLRYILVHFDERKRQLRSSHHKGRRWSELLDHPIASATCNDIYDMIVNDEKLGSNQQKRKKMRQKLATINRKTCFFNDDEPASIYVGTSPPFVKGRSHCTDLLQLYLENRAKYASPSDQPDKLFNKENKYADTLDELTDAAIADYNALRKPLIPLARRATMIEQNLPILREATMKLVDLCDQLWFALHAMVRIVDFSNKEDCDAFVTSYPSGNPSSIAHTLSDTMKNFLKHRRNILALLKYFNTSPRQDNVLINEIAAFKFMILKHDVRDLSEKLKRPLKPTDLYFDGEPSTNKVKKYAPLEIVKQVSQFVKEKRSHCFRFCYKDKKSKHILVPSDDEAVTTKLEDLKNSIALAKSIANGTYTTPVLGRTVFGDNMDKIDQECVAISTRAIQKITGGKKAIEDRYILIKPKKMCDSTHRYIKDLYQTVQEMRSISLDEKAKMLALSLLSFKDCEDEETRNILLAARVERALQHSGDILTGSLSHDEFIKSVQQSKYQDALSDVTPGLSDSDVAKDSEALKTAKGGGEERYMCKPAIEHCKESDMATCLMAALAPDDIGFMSHVRGDCENFRSDIEKTSTSREKINPDMDACDYLSKLHNNLSSKSSHSLRNVMNLLNKVIDDACDRTIMNLNPAQKYELITTKKSDDAKQTKLIDSINARYKPATLWNPGYDLPANAVLPPAFTYTYVKVMQFPRLQERILACNVSVMDMLPPPVGLAHAIFTTEEVESQKWKNRPLAQLVKSERVNPTKAYAYCLLKVALKESFENYDAYNSSTYNNMIQLDFEEVLNMILESFKKGDSFVSQVLEKFNIEKLVHTLSFIEKSNTEDIDAKTMQTKVREKAKAHTSITDTFTTTVLIMICANALQLLVPNIQPWLTIEYVTCQDLFEVVGLTHPSLDVNVLSDLFVKAFAETIDDFNRKDATKDIPQAVVQDVLTYYLILVICPTIPLNKIKHVYEHVKQNGETILACIGYNTDDELFVFNMNEIAFDAGIKRKMATNLVPKDDGGFDMLPLFRELKNSYYKKNRIYDKINEEQFQDKINKLRLGRSAFEKIWNMIPSLRT